MLTTPTLDRLREMKLQGMTKALEEQLASEKYNGLAFEERLGFLIDAEAIDRENRRLRTRLKAARLRLQACMEDIEYRNSRGLDRSLLRSLSTCQWIRDHQNVLITGSTGVGKSYVACAFGHAACMKGYRAFYFRASRLFPDLALAKADGRYPRLMGRISRVDVLILDDFGLSVLGDQERRDLLEILEDRYGRRSTVITSQLPTKHWHDAMSGRDYCARAPPATSSGAAWATPCPPNR